MKIGIEVNGVLRDTITKILQVYEKWYIDNPLIEKKRVTSNMPLFQILPL